MFVIRIAVILSVIKIIAVINAMDLVLLWILYIV